MGTGAVGLLDSCGAEGLSIQGGMGADGSGFFDGLFHLRIVLMEFHAQFQDYFLPRVLMDDLVASSSSRALLGFYQIWPMSVGGVMLLDPGVTAMGEMVVGTSSRLASTIWTSFGALTWT